FVQHRRSRKRRDWNVICARARVFRLTSRSVWAPLRCIVRLPSEVHDRRHRPGHLCVRRLSDRVLAKDSTLLRQLADFATLVVLKRGGTGTWSYGNRAAWARVGQFDSILRAKTGA